MRKLTFAIAVLASLGAAGVATSASAAPAPETGMIETVPTTWTRHHGMMHRRHMMRHRMMHRRHMMHHRMMHRRHMMRHRMHRM